MSLVTHIAMLESKHHHIDEEILSESLRPLPDFMTITRLKKQKLLLKEELARLARLNHLQSNVS